MIRFLQTSSAMKKVGSAAIVGVVIFAMVAFLGSYFSTDRFSGTNGIYATVGNENITSVEVTAAAQNMGRQQFQGRAVPEQFLSYFQKQAADQLVVRKAVEEEATRMGLKVTPQEVDDYLHRGEIGQAIFPKGQFIGKEGYENFVASNMQTTVDKFEAQVREQILLDKMFGVLLGSVSVPEDQLKSAYQKENVKLKFDYAVFKTEDLMKQVTATDSELKAWYE